MHKPRESGRWVSPRATQGDTWECLGCGEMKPRTAFGRDRRKGERGPNQQCRDCCAREARQWRASPAGQRYARVRGLWNRYGLSEADYNALYEAQGGRCAICEDPVANLLDHEGDGRTATALDHDHTTGAVRGILCPNCNTGLGGFRDDPERLRAAMAYLETSRMMTEMGT